MEYSGVMKGILDNGQFYTADIYKSKDKKCIISEFFTHFHQNDAENSFLDFISSRTSKDGTWLI